MRWLAIALLAACGGKTAAPAEPPAETKPVVVEDACAPAGPIALPADGRLHCRELPLSITFPPGSELTRQNDRALTLYSAKLEKGVMALVVEPRTDMPDSASIEALLQTLVKGIAADAGIAPATAPALAGATTSAALTFTTPDGGAGIARGYFANHWLFAVVVGARSPDSPSRPDKPVAQTFLSSLALKPLATGTQKHALTDGGSVELPASAWSTGAQPAQEGVRSEVIFLSPERGAWLGVRELEPKDRCDYLKGAVAGPTDDIADRLKTMYSNTQNPLAKVERAKYGDISVYAEADSSTRHVVMYLICAGKSVVQLTAAGEKTNAELRTHLDDVAKSFVGAK
jgi:hypothetical protein